MRKNRDLIKLISFDMLHDHSHIGPIIKETLETLPIPAPHILNKLVSKWYKKGLITEANPMHFIANIFSLTIFSLIAQPVILNVFGEPSMSEEEYFNQRISSITNLLKRGMLS